MESAIIGLCNRPFPLVHQPRGLIASSSSSRLLLIHHQQQQHYHKLLKNASVCASHHFPTTLNPNFVANYCIPKRLSLSPANNSSEEESGAAPNKSSRGVTVISFVVACVVGLMNFNSKMNPMFKTAYAAELFPGARYSLESLLESFTTKELSPTILTPPKYDGSDASVKDLKLYAVRLSKSNPKLAKATLANKYDTNKGWDENFNVKMALVELLIVQGEFKKAGEELDNFISKNSKEAEQILKNPSYHNEKYQRAQMVLYKFIIESMLKKEIEELLKKETESDKLLKKKTLLEESLLKKKAEADNWFKLFVELLQDDMNDDPFSSISMT